MEILSQFKTSVKKSLEEIDPKYETYEGLVICGTHSPEPETNEMLIEKIKFAREKGIPCLLICYGHQLAAIEYARNVLGIADATSEEFGLPGDFIIKKLPKLKVGVFDGESYWNNYEVDEGFMELWEKKDNFITCQYHPEYQSSKEKPHPLLVKFLKSCSVE